MTVQEHVVGDSPTAAHFRVLDWAMSDAFNSESLDVALKGIARVEARASASRPRRGSKASSTGRDR